MSFVAETHATASSGSPVLTIPSGTQGQDVIFVAVSSGTTGVTMPSGWAAVDIEKPTSGITFALYRKVAAGSSGSTSSDASTTVTVVPDVSTVKTGVTMVVWRGLDPSAPVHAWNVALYTSAGSPTSFAGPSVTTTIDGCDILTIFADKNSVNPINFTVPTGYTSRSTAVFTTGTGKCDAIVASKAGGSAGNYGADSWTADATPGNAVVFTVAMTPASTTQVIRPTSDVTVTNATGVPTDTSTNRYTNIDEAVLNLADYVELVVGGVIEVGLGTLTDPGVDTGFIVAYVLGLSPGASSATWTVSLKQSTTVIESWSITGTVDNDAHTHPQSPTDVANIVFTSGSAANLRLKFELTAIS